MLASSNENEIHEGKCLNSNFQRISLSEIFPGSLKSTVLAFLSFWSLTTEMAPFLSDFNSEKMRLMSKVVKHQFLERLQPFQWVNVKNSKMPKTLFSSVLGKNVWEFVGNEYLLEHFLSFLTIEDVLFLYYLVYYGFIIFQDVPGNWIFV